MAASDVNDYKEILHYRIGIFRDVASEGKSKNRKKE